VGSALRNKLDMNEVVKGTFGMGCLLVSDYTIEFFLHEICNLYGFVNQDTRVVMLVVIPESNGILAKVFLTAYIF
jgi:hypothetical protein